MDLEVVQNKCVSYDFYKHAADRIIYMESFGFDVCYQISRNLINRERKHRDSWLQLHLA